MTQDRILDATLLIRHTSSDVNCALASADRTMLNASDILAVIFGELRHQFHTLCGQVCLLANVHAAKKSNSKFYSLVCQAQIYLSCSKASRFPLEEVSGVCSATQAPPYRPLRFHSVTYTAFQLQAMLLVRLEKSNKFILGDLIFVITKKGQP